MRFVTFSQKISGTPLVAINPLQVVAFQPVSGGEGTTILTTVQNASGGVFGYTVVESYSEVKQALDDAVSGPAQPVPAR